MSERYIETKSNDGKRTDHYKYLAAIRDAKLLRDEKWLLTHYANTHNWANGECSWWSQRRICAHISMSEKMFRRVRKSLVDLGWIVVWENGDRQTPDIELRFGRNNPAYDKKEWAAWYQPSGQKRVPRISGNPMRSAEFSEGIEQQDQMDEQFRGDQGDDIPDSEGKIAALIARYP